MVRESKEILKKITQLVSLVESSNIQLIEKLKILKVLLILKVKLIELLPIEPARKAPREKSLNSVSRQRDDTLEKHELLLKFIREKGGRVSLNEFTSLGISGRSLRRYLKNLRDSNKIKIEKSGRRRFYELLTT